jgi:hypothetical protein
MDSSALIESPSAEVSQLAPRTTITSHVEPSVTARMTAGLEPRGGNPKRFRPSDRRVELTIGPEMRPAV